MKSSNLICHCKLNAQSWMTLVKFLAIETLQTLKDATGLTSGVIMTHHNAFHGPGCVTMTQIAVMAVTS